MDVIKRRNTLKINLSLLYIRNSLGFFTWVFYLKKRKIIKNEMVHFEACDNQLMLIFGSHGKFFYIKKNI